MGSEMCIRDSCDAELASERDVGDCLGDGALDSTCNAGWAEDEGTGRIGDRHAIRPVADAQRDIGGSDSDRGAIGGEGEVTFDGLTENLEVDVERFEARDLVGGCEDDLDGVGA